MSEKRLAIFFLLILALEMMLFSDTDAWRRRRRRRRRSTPPPPPCDSSLPFPSVKWYNKWRQSFSVQCRNGYSMSHLFSVYRGCQKDRIFHFKCSLGPRYKDTNCHWTLFSDAKTDLNFNCPHHGFITGVRSTFDKASNDRRLAFKCCISARIFKHRFCKITLYKNTFGELLNYSVPCGYTLVGVRSKHSGRSSISDRRWRFIYCKK